MSDTRKQWEGHVVDGKFPLLRYLGGSEYGAVFLTERRVNGLLEKAAIKLVPPGPENGETQLSRWRRAAELSQPHLISLHEMGRCEIDGMSLLYVLMELAEENLAQVLPSRALAPDEGRALLDSVVDAVGYLHANGFVHGRVKPENILASNDQLKISSDGLYSAGESFSHRGDRGAYDAPETVGGTIPGTPTMSPACDVWSLGITLVEALTQKLPVLRSGKQQNPLLPQTLPEPFLDIASHCLSWQPESRWTAAQIAARLEGRAPAPEVLPPEPPRASIPPRAPQAVIQPSRPRAKRRSYGVPVAGIVLALVAIAVVPRFMHRRPEIPQPPAADIPSTGSPATSEAEPPRQKPLPKPFEGRVAEKEMTSEATLSVPTSIHPETTNDAERGAAEKALPAGLVRGEVEQQVDPEVLQSARESIRGTVKVVVAVNVDRSGNVEDADLESPGPSKYFARAALQAAKLWKFKPPKVGDQGVLSGWTLRFEFTRDGTKIMPMQETP